MLVARRKLLREALALCDAVTLVASFAAAYVAVGFLFQRNFTSFAGHAWVLALILPIWLVCLRSFGFYSSAIYASGRGLVSRLVRMQFIAGLVLLSAMYLTRSEAISRLLLQTFLVVSFLLLAAQKFALRAYLDNARRRTPTQRRKVLLVSVPTEAERYLGLIRAHASMLADVVGMLAPGGSNGHVIEGTVPRVFGAVEDLPAVLQAQAVDEVVVVSALEHAMLERLSRWCSIRGILMSMLVELPRPGLGVWHAEHFGEGAFVLSLATIPQNAIHLLIKRIVDVVGAAIGIVLCAAAYVWYGVRLRRETGASVLFRQRRVGHNGRRFTLYKFRTMYPKAEQLKPGLTACNEMRGPIFKLSNDPRVTRTGRKLRRRHLDELPQFWNVLKGEMSLVGTRPPTEDETVAYAEHHQRRLSMKPGLTGLWQLNGNGAVKDFEEVVKLDCEYIDNWSLWLDCKIVAKTVTKVMRGDGW
jgi:exopolysaccharide biosynthesis polyprenyl glycosylphosphotransferase